MSLFREVLYQRPQRSAEGVVSGNRLRRWYSSLTGGRGCGSWDIHTRQRWRFDIRVANSQLWSLLKCLKEAWINRQGSTNIKTIFTRGGKRFGGRHPTIDMQIFDRSHLSVDFATKLLAAVVAADVWTGQIRVVLDLLKLGRCLTAGCTANGGVGRWGDGKAVRVSRG